MKLIDLISGIDCKIIGDENIEISSLFFDSKKTVKNGLFFCLLGTKTNGVLYADEAIKNGANAIVCNKISNAKVTQIITKDVRKTMAIMSANFYGNPQNKLKIVGITGTNGKTSTSYILSHMLKSAGKKVGVIGTSGIFYANNVLPAKMTTPDSIELFEILSQMVTCKTEYVVMEVSAHAIWFDKCFGIDFAIKVLTNVQSDHLDFFNTEQHYQNVKFSWFGSGNCFVVCGDDQIGKQIKDAYKNKTLTFGFDDENTCKIYDYFYQNKKTYFCLNFPKNKFQIQTNLVGKFNVQNIACACCCLQLLGVVENPNLLLQNLNTLDGRMQIVDFGQTFDCLIDYAHTLDAVKNLLVTVKEITSKQLIAVMGCPGERDSQKRFLIGAELSKYCSAVVLTSDNPARENPLRIMWEMKQGVKTNKQCKCYMIENRKIAIKKALSLAYNDTFLLVIGKGAEEYQIVGDRKNKHSDFDCLKYFLS